MTGPGSRRTGSVGTDAVSEEALVREWTRYALKIAARFYFPGAERDDVKQEALTALVEAIRTYKPERGTMNTHVLTVVNRRLMDKTTAANRLRHRILTDADREGTNDEGESVRLIDRVTSLRSRDTLDEVIDREDVFDIAARMSRLSAIERQAVWNHVNGVPQQVAKVKDKTMDNALWRARRKLAA